jgi:hypothetical protein
MANKVLKRVVTEYLKRLAEPRVKKLTGLDIDISLWGVNSYNELSGTQGKVFIDFDPVVNRNTKEGKVIGKVITTYAEDALKFVGQEKYYKVYINQRTLDPLDEQVEEDVEEPVNSNEYKLLERLLSHKEYEDNGIVFKFANFTHKKNVLSVTVNCEVPENRGWNEYMLEFFAYNVINEKIKFIDPTGLMDVKLDRVYVNGTPIKKNDYYLPTKLEDKLENIFKKLPDFGISYNDFGVLFNVKYEGMYDLYNDDYQIVVNCGFTIDKIILKKYDSNKKMVITSVPQDLAESLYTLLMESTDTELEELRYHIEGLTYREVFVDAFSLNETEENYLAVYLIPQKICGKKIEAYSGGDMDENDIEEYFRKLVSKSIN